jgi:hypothetical protein
MWTILYLDIILLVRFEVLMATVVKMVVFWHVAPFSWVDIDRRFRRAYFSIIGVMKRRSLFTTIHGTTRRQPSSSFYWFIEIFLDFYLINITLFLLLTSFMEQSPYCEANSRTAGQETYGSRRCITVFTRVCRWTTLILTHMWLVFDR